MKQKIFYVCQNCGQKSPKWLGKCPACQEWNTLEEEKPVVALKENSLQSVRDEFKSFREDSDSSSKINFLNKAEFAPLEKISEKSTRSRILTGISELDRALGGGLVPDAFTLLGGDPGIGKSTLLLQMTKGLVDTNPHLKVLYVTGEESLDQVATRSRRLGVNGDGRIYLAAETQLERVFSIVSELKPTVMVLDSLQTFSSQFSESAPGSVSQVREITQRLMTLAKTAGIAIWLVGHVTKEGSIAGPKTVEHMVDTVLYFEGEGGQNYRLLRTVKNRFGNTNELGVFEMDGEGLKEVMNPSSLFLSERKESIVGTSVTASLEGTRPLLVELQALCVASGLAVPRRTAQGFEHSRLTILAAILEKHMGLPLTQRDLFFNVAGGLKLSEPACDLAAAAAIWSSVEDISIPNDWIWIGECALTGEVRRVNQIELRIQEAIKLGFKRIILPASTPEKFLISTITTGKNSVKFSKVNRVSDLKKLF